MSLIDDALKRAAKEGTRRDAEKPSARPWTPPPLPERRRGIRVWHVAAVAGLAAAAALLPRIIGREPEPTQPRAAAPAPLPTSAPAAPPAAAPTVPPAALPTRDSPARRPAAAPTPATRTADAPEVSEPAAEAAAPAPSAPTGIAPAGIVLEGVVWSEDDPVAMINGRILRVGAFVDGYTITKIEPDAVELTGEKGTIRLKVGSGL